MLTSLGIVLFHALDFGLCDDEERTLSKPLELLIEMLTSAHQLDGGRNKRRHITRSTVDSKSQNQEMHSLSSFYDDHVEDEEDEDECTNDEGIERDCHDYSDQPNSSIVNCDSVNFDQVIQVCYLLRNYKN